MNGGLNENDLAILQCPKCESKLAFAEIAAAHAGETAEPPALDCADCGSEWPILGGTPQLVDDDGVRTADWFLNLVYDGIAPFHDFGTMVALPLAQGMRDSTVRTKILGHLDLSTLTEPTDRPLRILEVGSGTGINWPVLESLLPIHLDVELWAVDLSTRMLQLTRCRAALRVGRRLRTVRADAHRLPFANASFDRVFHIGAVATFGDPPLVLQEMARVAMPGTPIVVVDERLDPDTPQCFYRRALFKALTWYDANPAAPADDQLPAGARSEVVQVSPFFYCMTYRVGDVPVPDAKESPPKRMARKPAPGTTKKRPAKRRPQGGKS